MTKPNPAAGPAASSLAALGMVKTVEITNFRGFESFRVDDLAPINMIVGDNGIGKTAFLESIFLALSGHVQQQLHLRGWRGQDTAFVAGSGSGVVDSIFSDLFHDVSKESLSIFLR